MPQYFITYIGKLLINSSGVPFISLLLISSVRYSNSCSFAPIPSLVWSATANLSPADSRAVGLHKSSQLACFRFSSHSTTWFSLCCSCCLGAICYVSMNGACVYDMFYMRDEGCNIGLLMQHDHPLTWTWLLSNQPRASLSAGNTPAPLGSCK